ncbi:YggS family pyridoxal phosphate-dependent enzyme [Corynebacterium sp. HMSC28B08]|uniref:YggS family pyridoxal phosphate-dependent enzyme n=1 Tax=Corynebacterium sp. HMSC28B08 TaxID=1581066 RepID=UPI0008A2DDA9|nr:YggS family pyridoxal phosphate-dependent enzyme [Corynebacterium sp. HMSC28B08]OFT88425.1 YggS family pyridoxal phosphate enzyme [Corynebacterium sp. HMSC28B08]
MELTQQQQDDLAQRLRDVRQRVAVAGGADLLPITKFHPVEALRVLAQFGVGAVGENREQEAKAKYEVLAGRPEIHMVGQIQTKKANSVARWAAAVHTVDSSKLLQALDRGAGLAMERGDRLEKLPVLLQFSADGDPQRGGVVANDIDALADEAQHCANLELRGLMTVPPLGSDAASVFAQGRKLLDSIADRVVGVPVYSAGMSQDMEIAIAEGSTLVRVGTDIMGPRPVI